MSQGPDDAEALIIRKALIDCHGRGQRTEEWRCCWGVKEKRKNSLRREK